GPMSAPLRLGHNLLNVATGDESFGEAMDRSFNPVTQMQEDAHYWGNVGSALIQPYRQSIAEGRYGEVAGRGAFDIGLLLSGVGEVEGAAAAGEAANAARVGEAAEAARVAEGADAARAEEAAAAAERKPMGASQRNTEPLTEAEQAELRARAESMGMPGEHIEFEVGRPEARTGWGQMFGREKLYIADDVKPATAIPDAAGNYPRLSANQRVSQNGALAHELVGHREADLAGMSQTRSYAEYAAMSEEEKAAAQAVDVARDEAQASLRAAKFGPGLSNSERMVLFKDAMERLAKIGLGVDDVPGLGLHLGAR
ncbi:MAG: hypothetical protein K8W52_45665, partial [Deltaproteobacteria bacterium]|nr:hypothetical protein [Deltaproteobacteria bacterium]